MKTIHWQGFAYTATKVEDLIYQIATLKKMGGRWKYVSILFREIADNQFTLVTPPK